MKTSLATKRTAKKGKNVKPKGKKQKSQNTKNNFVIRSSTRLENRRSSGTKSSNMPEISHLLDAAHLIEKDDNIDKRKRQLVSKQNGKLPVKAASESEITETEVTSVDSNMINVLADSLNDTGKEQLNEIVKDYNPKLISGLLSRLAKLDKFREKEIKEIVPNLSLSTSDNIQELKVPTTSVSGLDPTFTTDVSSFSTSMPYYQQMFIQQCIYNQMLLNAAAPLTGLNYMSSLPLENQIPRENSNNNTQTSPSTSKTEFVMPSRTVPCTSHEVITTEQDKKQSSVGASNKPLPLLASQSTSEVALLKVASSLKDHSDTLQNFDISPQKVVSENVMLKQEPKSTIINDQFKVVLQKEYQNIEETQNKIDGDTESGQEEIMAKKKQENEARNFSQYFQSTTTPRTSFIGFCDTINDPSKQSFLDGIDTETLEADKKKLDIHKQTQTAPDFKIKSIVVKTNEDVVTKNVHVTVHQGLKVKNNGLEINEKEEKCPEKDCNTVTENVSSEISQTSRKIDSCKESVKGNKLSLQNSVISSTASKQGEKQNDVITIDDDAEYKDDVIERKTYHNLKIVNTKDNEKAKLSITAFGNAFPPMTKFNLSAKYSNDYLHRYKHSKQASERDEINSSIKMLIVESKTYSLKHDLKVKDISKMKSGYKKQKIDKLENKNKSKMEVLTDTVKRFTDIHPIIKRTENSKDISTLFNKKPDNKKPANKVFDQAKWYRECAKDLYLQDKDGDTILHIAIAKEEVDMSINIIKKMAGYNLDIMNTLGQTPLHMALYVRKTEIAQTLLDHGANIQIVDGHGNSPLHIACEEDSLELVKCMLEHFNGRFKPIKLLNIRNNKGLSAIHIATKKKNSEIIKCLLKYGADIDIQEQCSGETVLIMAIQNFNWKLAKLFIEKGADVNTASYSRYSPLHHAVLAANIELIKLLIEKGAEIGTKTTECESEKDLAKHGEIKKLLDKEMRRRRRKRQRDTTDTH